MRKWLSLLFIGIAAAHLALAQPEREIITPQNAADLSLLAQIQSRSVRDMIAAAWSPDGSQLAVAERGGVWLYAFSQVGLRPVSELRTNAELWRVDYSPDGTLLVVSQYRSTNPATWLWDVQTGMLLATLELPSALGMTSDHMHLLVPAASGIDYWGIPGGQPIGPSNAHRIQRVSSLDTRASGWNPYLMSLSPDSARLAIIAINADDETRYAVTVWDVEARALEWSQEYTRAEICGLSMAFSPDGQYLAVRQCDAVRLLETSAGESLAFLQSDQPDRTAGAMAFSPDSRLLVASTWFPAPGRTINIIRLWDMTDPGSMTEIGQIDTPYTYNRLMFNGDGTLLLAVANQDLRHYVHLWGHGAALQFVPLPTITPVPTATPSPTATAQPAATLQAGGTALIQTTGGDVLNVRGGPGRGFSVVTRLPGGTPVSLLEGPQDADGFRWWRIRTADGIEGWVVDEVDDAQTLVPAP